MPSERFEGLEDCLENIAVFSLPFVHELGEALQVFHRLAQENYFRHAIGFGRFTFLPATRARM